MFTEIEDIKKLDIRSMMFDELAVWVKAVGQPAFRAKQIFEWVHEKGIADAEEMTNVPKKLIEEIKKQGMHGVEEVTRLVSKQDGTNKFLFRLQDGNVLESVLMRYKHGNSVCISSQVGCRMGCRFCASTIGGLIRNLEASEMLDQIYAIERITGERVSNIVVMGTGEPLDNYDNLIRFIRIINDERGKNISQRNITVSSCGLVPQIKKLADEELSITFISFFSSIYLNFSTESPSERQYSRSLIGFTGIRFTCPCIFFRSSASLYACSGVSFSSFTNEYSKVTLLPVFSK